MEKIVITPGVIIEQSDLIDKIQDAGIHNLQAVLKTLYSGAGVIVHRNSNDLKVSYTSYSDNNLTLAVQAGSAITTAWNVIVVESAQAPVFNVSDSGTYYLYIVYSQSQDTPYKRYPLTAADYKIGYRNSYSFSLLNSTTTDSDSVLLATLDYDGSNWTVTDTRDKAELKKLGEDELTSLFDLIYDGYLGGNKVVVEADNKNLTQAINIHITDIKPVTIHDIDDTITMSEFASSGFFDNRCVVSFKWGWDDVVGSGVNQYFDVTSTLNATSLTNSWLYVAGNNYRITAWDNTGKRMTLENADGSQPDMSGISSTASEPAIVHTNADEYIAMITPTTVSGDMVLEIVNEQKSQVLGKSFPVAQELSFQLEIGRKYFFSIISRRGVAKTLATYMPGGSYSSNGNTYDYDSPFLAKLPDIDMTGADVVVNQAPGLIILDVQGMEDAYFEYGYTEAPTAVDFTNKDHHISVTSNREIMISIPEISKTYNIALRPVINGQVVGSTITKTITAGGYIKKIYDVSVADSEVYVHNSGLSPVYFGNVTIAIGRTDSGSWNDNVFTFDNINDLVDNRYIGYYLNFSGNEYLITGNTANTVTTSGQGTGSGEGHIGVNANKYNVMLKRYKADGVTVSGTSQYSFFKNISTHEDVRSIYLDPLIPNIKHGVKIIGETGSYYGDDWSDEVNFVVGCLTLTMHDITVTSVYGGVTVSFQPVSDAASYEGRYVIGEQTDTLPDPQFSQPNNIIGPTTDTNIAIAVEPGKQVKVAMRCLDKCGNPSSNIVIGSGIAGGQRYVISKHRWDVHNKGLTDAQTSESDRLITKFTATAHVKITSIAIFVDDIDLGSASYGKIRVYPDGSPSSAGMITFDTPSETKEQAVDIEVRSGQMIVVDGYDPSNPDTYPSMFQVDIGIIYQLLDV